MTDGVDHVLLPRTSVGVDRVLLSLTGVVDDHVLLSLTSVGVDGHALLYHAVVDYVRWRWPTMVKDNDGDDHRRLLSLKPIAKIN